MRGFGERGFTLLELMAVVTIIALLMTIAIPSITNRLREYRSQQAANDIAAVYRNARMRALARGSAVMVRWDQAAAKFTVYEAVQGASSAAGCAPLPSATCPTSLAQMAAAVVVNEYGLNAGTHTVTMAGPPPAGGGAGTAVSNFDMCCSPLGSASTRGTAPNAFAPLTGVPEVTVKRTDTIGLTRRVLVMPNGTSRVAI